MVVDYLDALIPLCFGAIVLGFPQVLTRRDWTAEANRRLKKRLRLAGILLLIAGGLVRVAKIGLRVTGSST